MKREGSWLFLLFVAFGAGAVPGAYLKSQARATGPAAPAGASGEAASTPRGRKPRALKSGPQDQSPDTAEGKLLDLLDAFDPGLRAKQHSLFEVVEQYRMAGRGGIFPMVATVPDPDASNLDVYYDQALDAIQRAAASEGFLPDRYFLPWHDSEGDDHPAAALSCGDVSMQCQAAAPDREHELAQRLPGILLFRRLARAASAGVRSPVVDLLVVFVVGELPKRGLDQEAFAAAINLACALRKVEDDGLFVLGPFFSGAALALRLALEEHARWHEPRQAGEGPRAAQEERGLPASASMVNVISGSVLDPANHAIIASVPLGAHRGATFETTSVPSDQLQAAIVEAIDRRLGEKVVFRRPGGFSESGDIAMLSESGTQWAASPSVSTSRWCHTWPCEAEDRVSRTLRTFHFPLHIARLRARREKSKLGASSDSPIPLRDRLELRLDRESESLDDLPARSSLAPYEIEIMLHDQLEEISRDHFRYLGVVATDPTDLVFIVQEARKYCPGVQIFTFGSHALLSHPDLMHDLNGVLIASTYPLAALTKHGETFASYAAEGMYNAMVVMLGRMTAREEDHPPRYKDWDNPFDPKLVGPQVWLSMVSNADIWPFHIEPPRDPSVLVKEAREVGTPSDSSRQAPTRLGDLTQGLYWLLLLLALAHTGFLWVSCRRRGCTPKAAAAGAGVAHVTVMTGALVFTCLLWALVAVKVVEEPGQAALVFNAGMLASIAALSALGMVLAKWFRSLVGPAARRPAPRGSVMVGLVLMAAVLVCVLAAWPFVRELTALPTSPDVRLALARTVQPLSGVSPALPLLWVAIGMYLWGLAGLRRVRARTRLPDIAPIPRAGGTWLQHMGELADRIQSGNAGAVVRIKQGAALLLVSGPCLFFLHELLPTFESVTFDPLFKVTFLLLVAAVTAEAGQLIARWQELRDLLKHLASHLMVDAYARAGSDGSPWLHLDVQPERPSPAELESALKVIDLVGGDPVSTGRQRERLRAEVDRLAEVGERTAEVSVVHACLFRLSQLLFVALDRLWRMGRGGPAHKDGQPIPIEMLTGDDRIIATAEVIAARQVMTVIRFALGQLRTRMLFVIGGALMLVFAIGAYPFHPMRFASVFVWSLVLAAIGVVLWLIIGVESDGVLSRMARTRPGRIDFNFAFVSKVFAYGMVPALVVVAKAFPEIGDILFSWLGPVMRAFHH